MTKMQTRAGGVKTDSIGGKTEHKPSLKSHSRGGETLSKVTIKTQEEETESGPSTNWAGRRNTHVGSGP